MENEFVNIGSFRTPVDVLQPTAAKDSFGQVIRSFTLFRKIFCKVEPVKSDEIPVSQRLTNNEIINFTTHEIPTLTTAHQIRYNSKNWNILSILRFGVTLNLMRITASNIET